LLLHGSVVQSQSLVRRGRCRRVRTDGAAAQDGCFAYIAAEHPDDGGSGGAAGPPIDDDLDDG
jgi:hypothetical protein